MMYLNPIFYAIPALVYTHGRIEQLRNEFYEEMELIEEQIEEKLCHQVEEVKQVKRIVHNGFREAYRSHF